MKQLITDIKNNQGIFWSEFCIAVACMGAFAVIMLFVFAVWGNG